MRIIETPFYIIQPYERGIKETLGRYTGLAEPGSGFQLPFVQTVRVRDVREHTLVIPPESFTTYDDCAIQVKGEIRAHPREDEESIKRTFYNIDNWKHAVVQLAIATLRQEIGDLTLDESLAAGEEIIDSLRLILYESADQWGIEISQIELDRFKPVNNPQTHSSPSTLSDTKAGSVRIIRSLVYFVRPYERGIQETLGRYTRFVMPGVGVQIPLLQIVRARDIRESPIEIPTQAFTTSDGTPVRVDGTVWAHCAADEESIKRTFLDVNDWKQRVLELTTTQLEQELGKSTLDEALVTRRETAKKIEAIVNKSANDQGVIVSKIKITSINPVNNKP